MTAFSRTFAPVALAAGVFFSGLLSPADAAAAPPKSFGVAKDKLGADTVALVSANGKAVRGTQLFTKLFAKATRDGEGKEGVELLKQTCGIDPVKAVDDVTIGLDSKDRLTVFVGLAGVTEQKLTRCVAAILKKEFGKEVKAKKTGDIIEFSDGTVGVYLAWLPGDVIAFTKNRTDRAALEKSLAGGFGKSALAARVAKLDADAALFGTWNEPTTKNGVTVERGDVHVVLAKNNVTVRVDADTASKRDADKMVADIKAIITLFASKPKDAPKEAHALIRSISARASGSTVRVEVKGTETEVLKTIEWFVDQF